MHIVSRRNFLLVLAGVGLVYLISLFAMGHHQQKLIDQYADQYLQEYEKRIELVMQDLSDAQVMLADDYSRWTALVDFLRSPTDEAFIEDNLSSSLRNYAIDHLFLLNRERQLVYRWDDETDYLALPLLPNAPERDPGVGNQFFVYQHNVLHLITFNSIHRNEDLNRTGQPSGWMLTASLIGPHELNRLSERLGAKIQVRAGATGEGLKILDNGWLEARLPLVDQNNRVVATLDIHRDLTVANKLLSAQRRQVLIAGGFLGLILLLFGLMLRELLARPLIDFSHALSERNLKRLSRYLNRKDELGHIAGLIRDALTEQDELSLSAHLDALTGLANRRHFDEFLEEHWQLSTKTGLPVGLIMIDVDHFKLYNDHYGHQAGDDCLRQLAALMSFSVRRGHDLLARYGGEEFAVILPGTDIEGCRHIAERIQRSLHEAAMPHAHSGRGRVSASMGIASLRNAQGRDSALLIRLADEALYRAKREGRDRYCVAASGEH